MKTNIKQPALPKLIKITLTFFLIILFCEVAIAGRHFNLFAVSDLVRVFKDGYKLPQTHKAIETFGIRGEVLSAQFALHANSELNKVKVSVSALKSSSTGNSLPATIIKWNFIGDVPLEKNAPNQAKRLVRTAPNDFPDYLMTERELNIPSGSYQAVWLTITIPESAEAGIYEGLVKVMTDKEEQTLPIKVRVYPLNMPSDRGLKIAVHYDTKDFTNFHGIKEKYSEEWFTMLKKYADNMAAHRQNVFLAHIQEVDIRLMPDKTLEFDYSKFDRIAQTFWDTGTMDYMETGYYLTRRGEGGWLSTVIELNDVEVINKNNKRIKLPGKDVIPHLLPAFENHLREKGWLDKTYFHILDEPSLHNAISWMEMSSYLHELAPGLIRMDALNTPYILKDVEVAVPMLDHLDAMYDQFKEGQENGTELWFYTTGVFQASSYPNKTIDMPLMDNRIMHWLNYKYDLPGYLHWGWNRWNENPLEEIGSNLGDAWHVYPAKGDILNSLRWEQMRNSLQDYEYFKLLEDKIRSFKDSLGAGFNWINPKQRSKEISHQIVKSLVEYKNDPQALYIAKKQVIDEILEFDSSPKVYLQTHPQEFLVLKNHASIEVFGWAEPGTKIVVNGQELPVNEDGLFLHIFNLTTSSNSIHLQASLDGQFKNIERNFLIEY